VIILIRPYINFWLHKLHEIFVNFKKFQKVKVIRLIYTLVYYIFKWKEYDVTRIYFVRFCKILISCYMIFFFILLIYIKSIACDKNISIFAITCFYFLSQAILFILYNNIKIYHITRIVIFLIYNYKIYINSCHNLYFFYYLFQ